MVSVNSKKIKEQLETMSIDEITQMITDKNIEIMKLKQQLGIKNKILFGSKSEKSEYVQLDLFNEIEDTIDNAPIEIIEEEITIETKTQTKKKVKSTKTDNYSKLPHEHVYHNLDSNVCERCGSKLNRLSDEITYELVVVPAKYKVVVHHTQRAICVKCHDDSEIFDEVKAKAPKRLLAKCDATSSLIASIACKKFVLDIPLYRQEKELERLKVNLSRQTMSNWLMKAVNCYFEPLFIEMERTLRKCEIKHMDETTLTVLEDKANGKTNSYEWLMMSGKHESNQLACFYYRDNRRHENVMQILDNPKGYVQSDGYQGYHELGDSCLNVGCMAHARREVVRALDTKKEVYDKYRKIKNNEEKRLFLEKHSSLVRIVKLNDLINRLYSIEHDCKDKTTEEIYKIRQEKSKPILDEVFICAKEISVQYLPQSAIGKAATYLLNNEIYLRRYVDDGRLEIDNNRAERMIKPFVIARKNFLFSNTKSGAKASSIIFSLIQSAIMNGLNPEMYLTYILDKMKECGVTKETLKEILPCSKSLPSDLYVKKASKH